MSDPKPLIHPNQSSLTPQDTDDLSIPGGNFASGGGEPGRVRNDGQLVFQSKFEKPKMSLLEISNTTVAT